MSKRTMPIKTVRLELDGDYAGWWVDIRSNPPVGLLLDAVTTFQIAQADTPENFQAILPPIYDMLMLVITVWNFVDEKGKDLPTSPDGLKKLPIDLLVGLAAKVQEVIIGLPLASSGELSSQS